MAFSSLVMELCMIDEKFKGVVGDFWAPTVRLLFYTTQAAATISLAF